MQFSGLKLNKKSTNFHATAHHLLLYGGFKKGKNTLTFSYEAQPKQALYFIGKNNVFLKVKIKNIRIGMM
jgi:aminopeptidase N